MLWLSWIGVRCVNVDDMQPSRVVDMPDMSSRARDGLGYQYCTG